MTGWRIGYTIANEEWTRAMVKLRAFGHAPDLIRPYAWPGP